MKVGDLVRHIYKEHTASGVRVGLVVELTEKKCWRTQEQGRAVNWNLIEPEAHAVVMYPEQDCITIPAIELEVVSEK